MSRFVRVIARFSILMLVLLASSSPILAQDTVIPTLGPTPSGGGIPGSDSAIPTLAGRADTCPVLVDQALARLDTSCANVGRNQACYGNFRVEAEPRPSVPIFNFLQPGDIVNVADIQTMRTRSLDINTGEWGISLFKFQANLPDALPGQNVTMLVFGDVQIENAPDAAGNFGTMQSFFVETSFSGVTCADTPRDGILLQTPPSVGAVELRINDVDISLASTVFIGYHRADAMRVFTLEGDVSVTAQGQTVELPPGSRTGVDLSPDGRAIGAPSAPAAFDPLTELGALPLDELPDPVTMPDTANLPTAVATGCIVTNNGTADANIRSRPALDAPIRGSFTSGSVAQVIGFSADRFWAQIETPTRGWVSLSVVDSSGECGNIPITFALLTATPTPTPTFTPTPAYRQAPDGEASVVLPFEDGASANLNGAVSFPDGNRQDTIYYSATDPGDISYFEAYYTIVVTCRGQGTENTYASFSDGTSVPCNPSGYQLTSYNPSGSITIGITGGNGSYVDWNVQIYLTVIYSGSID